MILFKVSLAWNPHFSANAGKVMPWTETTISITQNDTVAVMTGSPN